MSTGIEPEGEEEVRYREGEATSFASGVGLILAAVGLPLMRLAHLRVGPVLFTAYVVVCWAGAVLAYRWHKRRD